MSLTQIDFDLTSIAALLTILAIRSTTQWSSTTASVRCSAATSGMPMPELLNVSVNSTLSRSIITHVTVTLALLALLFFGGHASQFVATMSSAWCWSAPIHRLHRRPDLIYLGVGTGRMEADDRRTRRRRHARRSSTHL